MLRSNHFSGNSDNHPVLWIIALAIPALYINLGKLPLIGDEAIRSLVTLEMMLSGDYLTPTLNGELYFNKPPLYNWILTGFFRLFPNNTEFTVRLPTTLFLIGYCLTIYKATKIHIGRQSALAAALLFLTCGRILFWDSFLGLIDIFFSWITFLNFMLVWHYSCKKQYLRLFVVSYFFLSIGFLLKGLPSVAFQTITLLTLFLYRREFKKLLSWQHAIGISLFAVLIGTYYWLYFRAHPEDFKTLILRLFTESAQKSAIGSNWPGLLVHVFAFPLEVIHHFLPWTLLLLFAFPLKILKRALKHDFIRYCALIFTTNIIVYWLSPVTYPRYLLMLVPLLFILLVHLLRIHVLLQTKIYQIISRYIGWFFLLMAFSFGLVPILFVNHLPVRFLLPKAFLVILTGIMVFYVFWQQGKINRVVITMGLMLLAGRISFNLFLVPYRESINWSSLCRKDAIELARATKGYELFLATDTITIPNAYYITRERNEILRFEATLRPGPYYIVKDTVLPGKKIDIDYSMRIPINKSKFYAGRIFP